MRTRTPKPHRTFGIVAVLPMLFALYPLSLGPTLWMGDRGYLPYPANVAMDWFYWPLWFLGENVPVLGEAILWYVSLFVRITC